MDIHEIIVGIVIWGIIILTPSILILFSRFLLSYYSKKNPQLGKADKKELNEKVEKQEFILYIFNIVFSVIEIYVLYNYLYDNTKLVILLPIFIIGFSVIFRAIKKVKLSNILCGITVIPVIIIVLFFSYYNSIEIIIDSNTDYSSIRDFEPNAFNTKFSQYEGEMEGKTVKILIQDCLSSNINEENINRLVSVALYKIDASGNYSNEPIYILGSDPSNNSNRKRDFR